MMGYRQYITAIFALALLVGFLLPAEAAAEVNVLSPRGETAAARGDNDDVRDLVEDTFGDDHIMVEVARCESSFRQYDSDGDVLVNRESDAIGVFQLLKDWHEAPAREMDLNIYTAEGNVAYAEWLYEVDGLKPWSPSSLCWDDGAVAETDTDEAAERSSRRGMIVRSGDAGEESQGIESESVTEADNGKTEPEADQVYLSRDNANEIVAEEVITKKLIIGVHDDEVVKLQKLLNRLGYGLTESGPGSPGRETNYFGSLTKAALQEFQCEEDIICRGVEYSTGFGMTDEKTRAALNRLAEATPPQSDRVGVLVRDDDTARLKARVDELTALLRDLQAQLE